jgi:hypothetical protein
VLLALAGLLRPEAWLLAAVYGVLTRRPALALLAPVLWLGFDLLLTGAPLFSLAGTRTSPCGSSASGGSGRRWMCCPRAWRRSCGRR